MAASDMGELIATRPRTALSPLWGGVVLLVLAALWMYRDTARGMVALWGQSDTFAHGYVVPFITAWLLWRQRKAIATLSPSFSPAPSALLPLALCAALWFVGDLAEVNPVRQFALVAFVVLSVPLLMGWRAARTLLFPLCFLFFAVPFGEFLLPWLMAGTADFTVFALRATGIPVYRDGLQFVIPSGTWSVVEACSGVRYMIASLMVGALFAYLNYRSFKRRALFMLIALIVPVIANWLRAYMIVMIGHLSSNKLAVGVDHLIYGWVFFGVVVGLMFLLGARWAEPPAAANVDAPTAGLAHARSGQAPWRVTIGALVLLASPWLVLHILDAGQDRTVPRLGEPALADAQPLGDSSLPAWAPAYANPSASLARSYQLHGRPMGLYIAYYRAQGPGHKLVSSANALVRSSDPLWAVVETGDRKVSLAAGDLLVRTARLRRPVASSDATTLAVRQVYWVDGRLEASETRAKAQAAWARLRGRGDDGAVIIVFAAESTPGDADAALDAALREQLPAIEQHLRKVRDDR